MTSVVHDDMTFITSLEINNPSVMGDGKQYTFNDLTKSINFINKRYGPTNYLIRTSLVDLIKHKKKYEVLRRPGLVGVVIDDYEVLDIITMNSVKNLLSNFDVWFDVNKPDDLQKIDKFSSLIYGITSTYSKETVWDVIAWKLISNLDIKIFIYNINCYQARQCLHYFADYMQGDLWLQYIIR